MASKTRRRSVRKAIRRSYIAGEDAKSIADRFGVSVSTVYRNSKGLRRAATPPSDIEGEEWRELTGFDGKYFVSNMGRVFLASSKNGRRCGIRKPMFLAREGKDGSAYLSIPLPHNGIVKNYRVHRLVAEAFCPGHDAEHDQVNHKDGNRSNNRADNLEWVTQSENILHAIHVLGSHGMNHRKLTDEQVRAIRADERGCKRLAREYGVGTTTIKNIRSGLSYRDVQ